jgi:hypothetical protein
LIGDIAGFRSDFVQIIEGLVLPSLEASGLEFVTIFPHGPSRVEVQSWFLERRPVSFGVNTYTFDQYMFEGLADQAKELPSDYELIKLNQQISGSPGVDKPYSNPKNPSNPASSRKGL